MNLTAHLVASRRLRAWRGLAAVLAPCALALAPARSQDTIVELPPMMVEEKLLPLRWRYVAAPGFEVLSTCSDATIRRFVESCHRQDQLVRLLVPDRFRARDALPTIHLLADRNATRRISEEVMQELFAARGQKLPARKAEDREIPPVGFGRPEVRRRTAFLPNLRLDDNDVTAVFAMMERDDEDAGRVVFTAGRMAKLLERRVPVLPAWFMAGLVRIYESARFTSDFVDLAPSVWLSRAEAEAVAADPDRPRMIAPAAELFERSAPSTGDDREAAQAWSAQTELFVRWAMFSAEGSRREKLWRFLDLLLEEPASEELFRRCFDLGYADLRDRLSDYLPVAVAQRHRLQPEKFERSPRPKIRPASEDEIGRMRGDWERLEVRHLRGSHPDLAEKYLEQARHTLQRAYDRGARDPQFYAVWGLCEFDAGDYAAARDKLELATAAGVTRPYAYYALARLLYDEELRQAGDGALEAGLARRVLALLEASRRQAPLRETYLLLADVWMRAKNPPPEADIATLEEGVRLFPASTILVGRAAVVHLQQGRADRAGQVLTLALRHVTDPKIRSHYERLRARLAAVATPG